MSGTLPDLGQLGDGSMQMGFGGGASDPYMMELMRRRAMADALAKQGMAEAARPMTHWLQPLGSIVQQGVAAWRQGKADDELLNYAKGQAVADQETRRNIMAILLGGGQGAAPTPAPQPQPVAPSQGSGAAPAGGAPAPAPAMPANYGPTQAKAAFEYFTGQGFTPQQSAAMVANIKHESNFNPTLTHDGGIGYGVLGWNGPRLAAMRAKYGDAPTFQQQLEFMRDEVRNGTDQGMGKWGAIKSDDAGALGADLSSIGVRPRDVEGNRAARAATAQQYYQQFTGAQPNVNVSTATTSPTPSAPPVAAPTAAGGPFVPDKNAVWRAAVAAQLSGRPGVMPLGNFLMNAARAIPDPDRELVRIRLPDGSERLVPRPQAGGMVSAPEPDRELTRVRLPDGSERLVPRSQAANMISAPEPTLHNVSQGQTVIGRDGKPVFTNPAEPPKPDKLRSEFIDLTKDFRTIQDAHAKLTASARMSSAAGDLGVIFGIMKMYDPGSTVREGEQATAANAGGVPDRVRAMWNRALTGERLAPDVRADFVNQADILLGQQRRGYDQTVKIYGDFARQMGIDPKQVLADFVTPGVSASASAAVANPAPGLADDDIEGGFYRTIQPGSARPSPATQQRINPANPLGLTLPGGR